MTNAMLPVVHIHLGPALPPYFWETVRQTRRFHSGPLFCVIPRGAMGAGELAALSAEGIVNTRWDGASAVRRLRGLSWLDDLYGANGFWHHTLERLFVLAELMRDKGVPRVLHVENDVTIYFDPAQMAGTMEKCFGEACAVAPLGPGEGCTAAILYAGSRGALDAVCGAILQLLPLGEWKLRSMLRAGMVNESTLLGIVQRQEPALLGSFPILPSAPRWPAMIPRRWPRPAARLLEVLDRVAPRIARELPPHGLSNGLQEFASLFDGASWGQYAGGTPNGHPPGVAFRHHWAGPDLLNGRFRLEWRTDDCRRAYPAVIDQCDGGREWKLNNLHVHCKRIQDFV